MQLDTQDFLDLVEHGNKICFFDLESTGLRGDYNSILVGSILPFDGEPKTFAVTKPGTDKKAVEQIRDELARYLCWVSYYGKGFDVPMLQARLLANRSRPLIKKPHLDMYFMLNSHVLTARKSQAHRLDWLNVEDKKMSVPAGVWNEVLSNPRKAMPIMRARCESDTRGLRGLYKRTRHLAVNVTR